MSKCNETTATTATVAGYLQAAWCGCSWLCREERRWCWHGHGGSLPGCWRLKQDELQQHGREMHVSDLVHQHVHSSADRRLPLQPPIEPLIPTRTTTWADGRAWEPGGGRAEAGRQGVARAACPSSSFSSCCSPSAGTAPASSAFRRMLIALSQLPSEQQTSVSGSAGGNPAGKGVKLSQTNVCSICVNMTT